MSKCWSKSICLFSVLTLKCSGLTEYGYMLLPIPGPPRPRGLPWDGPELQQTQKATGTVSVTSDISGLIPKVSLPSLRTRGSLSLALPTGSQPQDCCGTPSPWLIWAPASFLRAACEKGLPFLFFFFKNHPDLASKGSKTSLPHLDPKARADF